MRVRTNSNTLVIDKLLDTPENKAIWAKFGPRAQELAGKVVEKRPNDIKAAAVYADSFMFSSSSKGILKQALQGAGSVFKENANRLIKLDRKHDSGVGEKKGRAALHLGRRSRPVHVPCVCVRACVGSTWCPAQDSACLGPSTPSPRGR